MRRTRHLGSPAVQPSQRSQPHLLIGLVVPDHVGSPGRVGRVAPHPCRPAQVVLELAGRAGEPSRAARPKPGDARLVVAVEEAGRDRVEERRRGRREELAERRLSCEKDVEFPRLVLERPPNPLFTGTVAPGRVRARRDTDLVEVVDRDARNPPRVARRSRPSCRTRSSRKSRKSTAATVADTPGSIDR